MFGSYSFNLKYKSPALSFGVVVILFIICPIAALPYIIKGCYNNDNRYYALASIFMGICALILFLPLADQYRHAVDFYKLKGEPWISYYLLSVANGQIDFTVNYLLYLANTYNLPFGVVRMTLTIFCSYLFLIIYDKFCSKYKFSHYERKFVFWLIFLLFPMSAICTGMRFATGVCIIVYVLSNWNIFHSKNIFNIFLVILAVFTHTGCVIPLIIYVLSFLVPNVLPRKILILFIVISFVISSSFYLVLQYIPLPEVLSTYVQKYTEGKFADSEYIVGGANIVGLIQTYVGLYGSLILVISIILYKYQYNKETKLLYLFIIAYVLTLNMFSLNGRIGLILTIYGGFLIINKWHSQLKKLTISLLCITLFLQLFSWRKFKYYNYEYLFTPIVFVLNGDYNEFWILNNVNSEGTIKDYW